MAVPTIDPRIIIKPSKALMSAVISLYEEESNEETVCKDSLPSGITKALASTEDSNSHITFDIEDIKWIYDRKKILNSAPLNHSSQDITNIKR